MGNKKEEAMRLIKEISGLIDIMGDVDPVRAIAVQNHLEDLRDVVMSLDVCQCEG